MMLIQVKAYAKLSELCGLPKIERHPVYFHLEVENNGSIDQGETIDVCVILL